MFKPIEDAYIRKFGNVGNLTDLKNLISPINTADLEVNVLDFMTYESYEGHENDPGNSSGGKVQGTSFHRQLASAAWLR